MRKRIDAILWSALALAVTAGSGCAYDEGLIIENLRGTVRVPVEAATRQIFNEETGKLETITDSRLIGPVYLGLYPGIEGADVIESYPHPEIGPQYRGDQQGDTYPYGGAAVGDLRFACLQSLNCKITSGRFRTWQDIIDWFDLVQTPVTDNNEVEVTSGQFLRHTCYDLIDITSDAEIRITAYEDEDGDGELDLDFELDAAGEYYEADFTIWQQEFFWDQDQEDCEPGVDCRGFSLWGWMDAPSRNNYQFTTCDPDFGFDTEVYDAEFELGSVYRNVLNFPADYITEDDWVSSEPYRWDNIQDEPTLTLDFEVQ